MTTVAIPVKPIIPDEDEIQSVLANLAERLENGNLRLVEMTVDNELDHGRLTGVQIYTFAVRKAK